MKKELTAVIGDVEVPVSVTPVAGDLLRVAVADRTYDVDAVMIRPGQWSLRLGDRAFVVDLEARRGSTLVVSGLVHALVSMEGTHQRRLAAKSAGGQAAKGERVLAPIAGKVVKILHEVGTVVAPGAGVIVLEAMKMENEIASERGGTIAAIRVAAGQSVETGELLLELT
ncbi:MAG: hypothetical protein IPL79_06865 [Myxococcales bacterium]|nr:hypothetical protein [Myxococcales bacterium]